MFSYTRSIQAEALHAASRARQTVRLIDVRSPSEYANGHAKGAVSIPFDRLQPDRITTIFGPGAGTEEPVYLISESGFRAEQALHKLENLGLNNLMLVDGGAQAWRARGLPMQRSSSMPSLESQAQMAVGLLLLAILAKAMLLHPAFYALIALLGMGLIVAGISARGSLTALISRMPWNRNPSADPSTARS